MNFIESIKADKVKRSFLLFVAMGVLTVVWVGQTASSGAPTSPKTQASVDTFIPAGSVLVPIEVANFEALDSILGETAVVDLFAPGSEPGLKGHRVARHIKMIRAPLNPSRFAVLATEEQAPELVRFQNPFFVVIQNPKQTDTRFEKKSKPAQRILIGNG